jgi:hypothetical protein
MKKIKLIIAGMSLFMLFLGAGVWADITLTDATGPDLVYQTSPGVDMSYCDNGTNEPGYVITSYNRKGTIEYGIFSPNSGYYLHEHPNPGLGSNATTAAPDLITSDWTYSGNM